MRKAPAKKSTLEERVARLQAQLDKRKKRETLRKEIEDRRAALKKL